jgi:hypothetical protein
MGIAPGITTVGKRASSFLTTRGVVASAAEAQRAMQIAQQVKGVKAVHNRLRVQEGRPEPAPRPSSSSGKTLQEASGPGERRTRMTCNAERGAGFAVPLVCSHRERYPS